MILPILFSTIMSFWLVFFNNYPPILYHGLFFKFFMFIIAAPVGLLGYALGEKIRGVLYHLMPDAIHSESFILIVFIRFLLWRGCEMICSLIFIAMVVTGMANNL